MKSILGALVGRAITGALVVAYCLIGLVAFAAFSGYRPVVLTSGSMAPAAAVGALVISAPAEPEEIQVGNILVMNTPSGTLITHRVVELSGDGSTVMVTTKGDANNTVDPEPYLVNGTHLTGRWIVPRAGTVLAGLATPLGPVVLLLAAALAATMTLLARRSPPNGSPPTSIDSEAQPPTTVEPSNSTVQPSLQSSRQSSPQSSPQSSRGLRVTAVVALLLGALSLMRVSSMALFTDSETVNGNAFTIGSVDLGLSQNSALVTYTAPPMSPGDQFTAPLTVSNIGTLDLRYAMSSTTTEDLAAAGLVLTIKTGVTTCDDANWTTDGTAIYTGVLGTTGGTAAIGSAAQGAQAGDRALAVAASEVLCFNVTLPTATTNAVQGITTTATFAFEAEQTANN